MKRILLTTVKRDADHCGRMVGAPRNGEPTSAAFKRCMGSRGWRFDYTTVEQHRWRNDYDPTFQTCPLMPGC